jgi:hypothetical protein
MESNDDKVESEQDTEELLPTTAHLDEQRSDVDEEHSSGTSSSSDTSSSSSTNSSDDSTESDSSTSQSTAVEDGVFTSMNCVNNNHHRHFSLGRARSMSPGRVVRSEPIKFNRRTISADNSMDDEFAELLVNATMAPQPATPADDDQDGVDQVALFGDVISSSDSEQEDVYDGKYIMSPSITNCRR